MRADEYFGGEWLDETPRLRRLLAKQGIATDDLDDVLQETAIRLCSAWDRLYDGRPLRPLVTTIALNVARDHYRRSTTRPRLVEALPDDLMVDTRDVDTAVLARLEVDRAARALSMLAPAHRQTVLDAVADDLSAEQSGRTRAPASVRMARTRARRQLIAAFELIAGLVGLLVAAVRRPFSSPATQVGLALTAAAASLAVVWHPGAAPGHVTTPRAAAPAPQTSTFTLPGVPRNEVVGHIVMTGNGSWSRSGTSNWWPWGTAPLVSASALGHRTEFGPTAAGRTCRASIADSFELVIHCDPLPV